MAELEEKHKRVIEIINNGGTGADCTREVGIPKGTIGGMIIRLRKQGHIKVYPNTQGKRKTGTTTIKPKISKVVVVAEQPQKEKYVVIVGSNLKEILNQVGM